MSGTEKSPKTGIPCVQTKLGDGKTANHFIFDDLSSKCGRREPMQSRSPEVA